MDHPDITLPTSLNSGVIVGITGAALTISSWVAKCFAAPAAVASAVVEASPVGVPDLVGGAGTLASIASALVTWVLYRRWQAANQARDTAEKDRESAREQKRLDDDAARDKRLKDNMVEIQIMVANCLGRLELREAERDKPPGVQA